MNHEAMENSNVVSGNFAQSYRDLRVFQQAYAASLEVHKLADTLPSREQFELAKQLRRSSKSVCANVVEGFGKQHLSKAEFRRFILMSIGSAEETMLWLDYCRDLNYLPEETTRNFQAEYAHVINMLHKLQQTLKG